jgi:hypothetical protein
VDSEFPSSPGASVPQNQIALSPLQQQVLAALSERSTKLADMYLGAIAVFQQPGNPDRVALAAHDLRELMEKAPKYLDLDMPSKNRPSLNQTVIDYAKKWEGCKGTSENHSDGEWGGEIDVHLQGFLKTTETFVTFYKETHTTRIEQASSLVCQLDPLRERLPDPLQKLRAQEWHEIYDFFVKVSHHGGSPIDSEFERWIEALGRFLLAGWRPETATDQENLKRIIEEGETDA